MMLKPSQLQRFMHTLWAMLIVHEPWRSDSRLFLPSHEAPHVVGVGCQSSLLFQSLNQALATNQSGIDFSSTRDCYNGEGLQVRHGCLQLSGGSDL